MFNRRDLIQLTASLAAAGMAGPAGAAPETGGEQRPRDAAQAHLVWAKLNGDLSGRTIYYVTQGIVWGFKPQADDLSLADFAKRFYGYIGCSARKMHLGKDGAITVRSKSWNFYREPRSLAIVDQLHNPYTGATNACPPMSGPASEQVLGAPREPGRYPVEFAPEERPYDMRIERIGPQAWVTTSGFTRLRPGDIDWWKLEGELDNYQCLGRDLDNPHLTHIPNTRSQNLVAEWQTWTKMHGTPGHILFKGDGAPLADPREIPTELVAAIDKYFPGGFMEVLHWDR
jgi:hypothetical protein